MKSILPFDREICIECGGRASHTHHCLFGRNRKNSEKYGLKVRMCWNCHRRLHDKDTAMALKYMRMAQRAFEAKYGHAAYMEIFGKNYLEDGDEHRRPDRGVDGDPDLCEKEREGCGDMRGGDPAGMAEEHQLAGSEALRDDLP